jgi:glycosyltransferase involved in cell wall biosynthesis
VLFSPLPPPAGGIGTWTLGILSSPLAREFELRIVNTAPSAGDAVHGSSRFRGDRLIGALRILTRLCVELIRFRPQLVHVNTSYFWAFPRDAMAVWIARLFGARSVLHFRGGDFPEFAQALPRWLQVLVRATLRRTDRLIPITRATESYLTGIVPPERVRLIPNFIALQDVGSGAERSEAGLPEALFVGWIIEGKGIGELLEAARKLPEVRFTLVGAAQPSYLARLRERLDACSGNVSLLGPRPRSEVMELYRRADLFVLPTYREGFPNVILEAMAAGLPIVATPVGAIPDAVRDGEEGLLVPPRDPEALVEAIRTLARDPVRRRHMGRLARQRVEALYTVESVAARLASLYRDVLGSPR